MRHTRQRAPRAIPHSASSRGQSGKHRPTDRGQLNPSAVAGDVLIKGFLERLDSPRALTVWILYSAGDAESHRQLVELTCDIRPFDGPDEFRRRYAATKFLSKSTGLNAGIDLDEVAIATARKAELRCRHTNELIRLYRSGNVELLGLTPDILLRAQGLIAKVLNRVAVPHDGSLDVGFSRGRTTSASGEELSATHKYGSRLDITRSASDLGLSLVRGSPQWGAAALNSDGPCSVLHSALNIVEGNKLITVPKNAKTNRVICYEPHVNIRLQLSAGSLIRRALRTCGVNLDDQSINQRRAKLASILGHLCTMDLSSASDTIATELVYLLLPLNWAMLLDSLRSKQTLWPGEDTYSKNEKFSSMGNGFTFELESLIFWALATAVCGSGVSVYGDDIIIPTAHAAAVRSVLEGCGFVINESKTFSSGPFRESCGADMFRGSDVTPVYCRRKIITPADLVQLHNAVRAFEIRSGCPEQILETLLQRVREIVPAPVGPSGYGDGHYHVDFDRACPSRVGSGFDAWRFKSYIREYTDHKWADLHTKTIPSRFGAGALCAGTGPKRAKSVWDLEKKGKYRYRLKRMMCHFQWPSVVWV